MSFYKFILRCFTILFLLFQIKVTAQTTPDPGLMGSYLVAKEEYDLGELAFKPPSFPNFVELRGSVHYPATLVGGPFPVIFLLHGRHSTVFKTTSPGTTGLAWPPPVGYESITSFEGYDYFAEKMASHGYIVISVSCNAINAADNSIADRGMKARGELLQKHLDLWNDYNTIGGTPFSGTFVGKLNMQRIGTMGHSRGGEGVIHHALLNNSLGKPYGIKAVITLAPVDFQHKVMSNIPLLNIAPYCDGDVTALSGVHYYDDARYKDTADEAPKHSLLVMGANHNFFNTVWTPGSYIAGTSDDWDGNFGANTDGFCGSKKSGNKRLDTTKQKATFTAYAMAFFRTYVGKEIKFNPILETRDRIPPASTGLDSSQVFMSYHAGKSKRLDVNRTDTSILTVFNNLNGAVTTNGLVSSGICGAGFTMLACAISATSSREPHKGTTTYSGLGQMAMNWDNDTDYYQNELPNAYKNTTAFEFISFRAAINFKETPTGKKLDFSVQLIDSIGAKAKLPATAFTNALYYPPGTQSVLPKAMFNTIKIPLNAYKGIDQSKIKFIRFLFDTVSSGSILISDLTFEGNIIPCGIFKTKFKDSLDKSYTVYFKDSTIKNAQDSLVWNWSFGDPLSGAANSSVLQNPNHKFSNSGSYTVCLYVSSYRSSGLVCKDTFCKTINLMPNAIVHQNISQISISPNPVNNYLIINGAQANDEIELRNLFGQLVLSSKIAQQALQIPISLPNGMYIAIVHTARGNFVEKVIIER